MAEEIRSELKNVAVHIVMLTTENSPSMKERGRATGVKGWIVNPFNGAAVLGSFKNLLACESKASLHDGSELLQRRVERLSRAA